MSVSAYLAPKDPFDNEPPVKFLLNKLQLGRWEYRGQKVAGPRNSSQTTIMGP